MNVLIAPDSFKGTLTAVQAAHAMAAGVRAACPGAQLHLLPMADGGEGTLEVVLAACGRERRQVTVAGADGQPLRAEYGVVRRYGAATAVIEVARVVGPGVLGPHPPPAGRRDSRGVGELLRHALDAGLRHFWVGLGGSATNDGGAGLLAALGVVLRDAGGRPLPPTPEGLAALASLDFAGLEPRLAECDLTLLADVQNPLCGPAGATRVYGRQKGVSEAELPLFERRLQAYAALGDAWAGRAVSRLPGAGAAGGLGYALQLLGARHGSGAAFLCDLLDLQRWLAWADLLVTGEGRSDAQTLQGKAPWILAQRAGQAGVPAVLVSGSIDPSAAAQLRPAFLHCVALEAASSPQLAMRQAGHCLEQACRELLAGMRLA